MIIYYNKAKSLLFDGREPEILNKTFNVDAGADINVAITLNDFAGNNFESLPAVIGIAAFDLIVKTGGFITDGGFLNLYKGSHNLRRYYYKKDNVVIVLAYGEFQPGRYMLLVEGVWVMD